MNSFTTLQSNQIPTCCPYLRSGTQRCLPMLLPDIRMVLYSNRAQNAFFILVDKQNSKNAIQCLKQDEQRRLRKHRQISCQFLEPVKCNISFTLTNAMIWDFLSCCDKTSLKCKSSHVSLNRGYREEIFDNIIDVFCLSEMSM